MENEKTFDQQISELAEIKDGYQFNPELVSRDSIDQLIKAHELKYVENILEVDEENKLAKDNIKDFLAYDEETQKAAVEAYDKAQRDPEYWNREGVDQKLYKPVLILNNIANKKNEAKIKTWKVEYHARLIGRLTEFRFFAGKKLASTPTSIIGAIISLFKNDYEIDDHGNKIQK